ncbi:hypothetical protein [Paraburkholderia sp. J67]|uniref:hypothetical protein n=1 Tax=Paraburkholderia sp. J67 TaxID=2805435 RepID=UPI002ABD4E19|nr:hypothetical protein [Paraburkholderia sp. J67]
MSDIVDSIGRCVALRYAILAKYVANGVHLQPVATQMDGIRKGIVKRVRRSVASSIAPFAKMLRFQAVGVPP